MGTSAEQNAPPPAYTLVATVSAGYYAYTIGYTTTHASCYVYTIRFCNYTTTMLTLYAKIYIHTLLYIFVYITTTV